jgi:hypothetical protein
MRLKAAANVGLLLASFGACLVAADWLLYRLFVAEPLPNRGLYQADPEIGYRLTPGYSGTLSSRGPTVPITINAHGFRGQNWDLSDGFRLLFAGDSYTFGIPLAEEQGFVAKVARKVPGARTYNLGVPGYGPPAIAKTVERHCDGIRPDHIFYMYYLNDTRLDNVAADWNTVVDGYLVPRRTKSGQVLGDDELRERITRRLAAAWTPIDGLQLRHLRTFLAERGIHPSQLWNQRRPDQATVAHEHMASKLVAGGDYSESTVAAAALSIQALQAVSAKCGARFTMVVLPGNFESFHGTIEEATQRLLGLLGDSVEILDLRRFTRPGHSLIQWYDAHYSELGTDMVSDAIAGYLAGRYPEKLRKTR